MNRLVVLFVSTFGAGIGSGADVTFYKNVLPVLQKHCQGCHRPGEAAPMTFLSYKETRPWAKAIKQAVLGQRMPPWFADPSVGKFHNARVLSAEEKATLVEWANTGAAGDEKDAPAPVKWAEGWAIGKPDAVYEMPESYAVPSAGTIEYTYFIVPTGFTEDKWITAAEARPGARAQVHHIIAFIREPGSKWLREYPPGKGFVPKKASNQESGGGVFLTGYAPGTMPEKLEPGQAKLIRAGSDIVFQMHYTANGKTATDVSRLGMVFANEEPKQRVLTLAAQNGKFVIPAGAPNHRVDGAMTLHAESELTALFPHMHVRGKAFEMRAVYPTGESEVLLKVPAYDFNWQLSYRLAEAKKLPKGTRIEATGWFDNSANNKSNPDPTKDVRWGDQSWEEMMIGFFNVAIDVKAKPGDLYKEPKRAVAPATTSGGE